MYSLRFAKLLSERLYTREHTRARARKRAFFCLYLIILNYYITDRGKCQRFKQKKDCHLRFFCLFLPLNFLFQKKAAEHRTALRCKDYVQYQDNGQRIGTRISSTARASTVNGPAYLR